VGANPAGGDHQVKIGSWRTFVVAGDSMLPALRTGDCLLVASRAPIRVGDIVAARHPLDRDLVLVKRIARRADDGWWLLSDNAAEGLDDSRAFGVLPDSRVLGRVVLRYYPFRRSTSSNV
jgi:nickel-type superoxide dismutase maturation protease